MGLDVVELVMECEDEFNIAIPDEDYEHLQSVGAMYEYVIRKKEREIEDTNRPRVCLTMITFSLLRPALQSVAEVPRRSIRTKTTTDKLIPQLRRRSDWKEIQVLSGLQLPQLDRPTWMDDTLLTSVIVAVAIVIYWLATIMHVAVAVGLGLLLIGPLLFRLLSQLTQPLASLIPADCATIGGLSRSVESLNRGILEERYNGWSSEYVWRRLRGIVSEQLGVPLDQVNYDSRFVEDLGAD